MNAVAMAMTAALAWGLGDFIAGIKSRQLSVVAVLLVSQAASVALMIAVVAGAGEPLPSAEHILLAMLAGVFGVAALGAFYRALVVGKMSVVAPISATDALIPVAFGVMILGERPPAAVLIGVTIALAGVVIAVRADTDESEETGKTVTQGAGLAIIAAVCFGCFVIAIDAASEGGAAWAALFNHATAFGLACAAAFAVRPQLPTTVREMAPLAAIGALESVATLLFAISTTLGMLSVVGMLGSLYPLVTILLARMLLGERLVPFQRIGVTAALLGVVLITAGHPG